MSQTEQIQHTDSLEEEHDLKKDKKKKDKSKRPANTAFRQQRLKAWQPILTPKTVLPLFFAVGIIFAPIGGLLLWASTEVQEIAIDYSRCIQDAPLIDPDSSRNNMSDIPSDKITKHFKDADPNLPPAQWGKFVREVTYDKPDVFRNIVIPDTNICRLQFEIESEMGGPILLYYRLSNFYQNHRRYVKSYDASQLAGHASDVSGTDCSPLDTENVNGATKKYYPCGLIANSIFNDTFQQPAWLNPDDGSSIKQYDMTTDGIAWDADGDLYKNTEYNVDDIVPPPNWRKKFPEYNSSFPPPDIHKWEELWVWMRTAGLPTFSKLALRNDNEPLRKGRYQIDIWDEFNVTLYDGTKEMLISTTTVMGGKNPFLGIAYIVVGGLCVLLGAIFTVTHLIKPRKLGDHTYLTWNRDEQATATATGSSVRPGNN